MPRPTFDKSVYFVRGEKHFEAEQSWLMWSVQCITELLLAFATIIAITRAVIRVRMFHNVFVDDYFFFLAFLALVCSNGLFYYITPLVYLDMELDLDSEIQYHLYFENSKIIMRFFYPAEVLAWTTIFSVKFSFLLYFRTLINRLHALMILWWCVLFFCIPVACIVIIAPLVTCIIFDDGSGISHSRWIKLRELTSLALSQCNQGFHLYLPTIADIVTDVLSKTT